MNIGSWVDGTLNQLLTRGSLTEINFSKKKIVNGKTLFFAKDLFCTPHSICLSNGFLEKNVQWKCCACDSVF